MKVYIPNTSEQSIGGGWTFLRNFKKGMAQHIELVDNVEKCDLLFIVSASMTDADDVERAHAQGKKIVFRVDNIPKKSRNKRGRIYDKMRRYGELADVVVFQSEWAKEYAGFLTGVENSIVIYNGVDIDIFNTNDRQVKGDIDLGPSNYLFVQFNRDDNKRWPEAAYHYHMVWRKNKKARLTIVGKFSPENFNDDGSPHFDFFGNEPITYIPPVEDPDVMASIYKDHEVLLFPAFGDAAPNTVLEAIACGMQIELVNPVGGTVEMVSNKFDLSLGRMCTEYNALFNLVFDQKDIET